MNTEKDKIILTPHGIFSMACIIYIAIIKRPPSLDIGDSGFINGIFDAGLYLIVMAVVCLTGLAIGNMVSEKIKEQSSTAKKIYNILYAVILIIIVYISSK